MGRFLGFLLLVALVLVLIYFGYQRYHKTEVLNSGAVTGQGLMTPEQKTAFERENAGEGPDGQSEHKWDFSRGPDGEKREWSAADETGYSNDQPGTPTNEPQRRFAQDGQVRQDVRADRGWNAPGTIRETPPPTRDSVPAYPPNGVGFAGRGEYQWYRQGNITWRVDTVTGRSCIAYATLDEWRKRLVMEHGCGSTV